MSPDVRSSIDSKLLRFALVALAYYACARFGLATPYIGTRITLVWLPTGVAVAALYRWGREYWPAVFLAAVLANAKLGPVAATALAIGAGNTLGPALAAWLLERLEVHPTFDRQRDVVALCAAAAVGMLVPATGGVAVMLVAAELPARGAAGAWLGWWIGDTVGVLLAAPLLLALWQRARPVARSLHAELLIGCVALAAVAVGLLITASTAAAAAAALFLPLLLILGTAARFGVVATSACAVTIAILTALASTAGGGAYPPAGALASIGMQWAYLATLAAAGLLVAAVLAERTRAEAALVAADERYRRLFECNPLPMWIYDRDSLRVLEVNAAAIDHYGYGREEFLALSMPELEEPEPAERQAQLADWVVGSALACRAWRHRLRSGRLIDVEVLRHSMSFAGRPAEVVLVSDVTERRMLESAALQASAREQRRLGRELHEGLGQQLSGFALATTALAVAEKRGQRASATELEQLSGWASSAVASCAGIARALSPPVDARGGLAQALEELVRQHRGARGPSVRFDVVPSAPLGLEVEAVDQLYRIAEEGLVNALRHARCHSVHLLLDVRPGVVRLQVFDDGCGIPDACLAAPGLGLRTLRYRASLIGARLTVARRKRGGTLLLCDCPQPPARALDPAASRAERGGESLEYPRSA